MHTYSPSTRWLRLYRCAAFTRDAEGWEIIRIVHRCVRSIFALVGLTVLLQGRVFGQPTNAEIIGRLASDCVIQVTATTDTLRLVPDPRYEFVRTSVVSSLMRQGTVVIASAENGGTATDRFVTPFGGAGLRYRIEDSAVAYQASGKLVQRDIELDVRLLSVSDTGIVLSDTLCSRDFSDQIGREDVQLVEDPELTITHGNQLRSGWIRRIAEPVVVGIASAVAVYLFFNVRSDRNNSQ